MSWIAPPRAPPSTESTQSQRAWLALRDPLEQSAGRYLERFGQDHDPLAGQLLDDFEP